MTTEAQQYYYFATSERSSAALDCVAGHFLSPDETTLIVSHGTHLSVYSCVVGNGSVTGGDNFLELRDGSSQRKLVLLESIPLMATVRFLRKVPIVSNGKEAVVLITEKSSYMCLTFQERERRAGEPPTSSRLNIQSIEGEFFNPMYIEVSPTLCATHCRIPVAALHSNHQLVRIIDFTQALGSLSTPPPRAPAQSFNVRIDNLEVLDIAFAYGEEAPEGSADAPITQALLFVLHRDRKGHRHVAAYRIDLKTKSASSLGDVQPDVEPTSTLLRPLLNGCLVIGESQVSFVDEHGGQHSKTVVLPREARFSTPMAVAVLEHWRCLLCMRNGVICAVALKGRDAPMELELLKCEQTNKTFFTSLPSCACYFGRGSAFIGSAGGNSLLVDLLCGTSQVVLENAGPVMDMCVVEENNRCMIVTASGFEQEGAITTLRSSVGITEEATLPGICGVAAMYAAANYLVLSFANETRVLAMAADGSVDEVCGVGIDGGHATKFCASIVRGSSSVIFLVTAQRAAAWESGKDPNETLWAMNSDSELSVADIDATSGILAVAAQKKVTVHSLFDSAILDRTVCFEEDVGCVTLSSRQELLVGLWVTHQVVLVDLKDSSPVAATCVLLQLPVLPRSLCFVRLQEQSPLRTLVVGLVDGSVMYCQEKVELKDQDCPSPPKLQAAQKVALGVQPVQLTRISDAKSGNDVFSSVVCCNERPAVIFQDARVQAVGLALDNLSHCCQFGTSCAFVVGNQSLILGSIDTVRRVAKHRLTVGSSVQYITYYHPLHDFVAAVRDGDHDTLQFFSNRKSSLENRPELTQPLLETERCSALLSTVLGSEASPVAAVIAGTAFHYAEEPEPRSGRIVVFAPPTKPRDAPSDPPNAAPLSVLCEKDVRGGVYSLCSASNYRFLAAVCAAVELMKYNEAENELVCESSLRIGLLPVTMRWDPASDTVAVGDLTFSVVIARVRPTDGALEVLRKDVHKRSIMDLAFVGKNVLAVTEDMNAFALAERAAQGALQPSRALETHSAWHVGERINVLREGSFAALTSREDIRRMGFLYDVPPLIYATNTGSLGCILTLDFATFQLLTDVQVALLRVVDLVGPSGGHVAFRRTTSPQRLDCLSACGVVDGDLVELFGELPRATQEAVACSVAEAVCKRAATRGTFGGPAADQLTNDAVTSILPPALVDAVHFEDSLLHLSVDGLSNYLLDVARLH